MKRMRLQFSLAVAAVLFAAPAASAKTVAWYHFNEGANGEAMRGGEGVYAVTNATDSDVFEATEARANTAVSVAIPQTSLVKGLNELKWVYHYDEALKSQDLDSSYMGFDCHLLKFVSPPQGFMTIIRNRADLRG